VDPERTPVVLAAAETSEREDLVGALDLAERACAGVLADSPGLAGQIDRLEVVAILAGGGPSPASDLAARLGIETAVTATTTIGGNTPQWLVGRAADDIAAGRARAVLIAGAEALRSHQALRSRGGSKSRAGAPADSVIGDDRPGLSDVEMAAGLLLPAHVYPLFESAIALRSGRSFDDHRTALGHLMSPFTQVAATRVHAWFPETLTPQDISTPTQDNRVTAEPYTKRMNAVIAVDQGAAVAVTSLAVARDLGLEDRAVFVWSAGDASDVWFPSQRPDLASSPAIAAAVDATLEAAGAGVDDMARLDLYSCFPSAVEIAAAALGVSGDDPRCLTVTGGLPYFGGPGNNYCTHAIAALAESLRGAPARTLGLVTGLGWYITKHSAGVYGSTPPPNGYRRGDTSAEQARIDLTSVPVVGEAGGGAGGGGGSTAVVDAATVIYDREGTPTSAPIIATLADGRRVVARASDDDLPALAGRSIAGSTVRVTGRPPTYRL
jgi:acetyl-CoA C-acetyltransferase